jgi:hypothetical protein
MYRNCNLNHEQPDGLETTTEQRLLLGVSSECVETAQRVHTPPDRGNLQKTPLIYINVGYRLGAFGFPDGTEAVAKGALNLGLKDQIAALQWIQANIEYFGGDKSKVRSSH